MTERSTGLIHHPYEPPAGFSAPQVGVHKASTIIFPNVAALRSRHWKNKDGYTYGLHGTPTTFTLEQRIATLEGGTFCALLPSGLAAIANVNCAMLKAGDEVLLPDNVYGPSRTMAEVELRNWGITHALYDPMRPEDLAARINERTRLVWLEVPGSVSMEFPPMAQLVRVCRERGVLTALDNTWGAGIAFNGFDLGPGHVSGSGADIVMQALTKYPSGGGDVLMGSVVTRDEKLHDRIMLTHMRLGWGISGNDAEAVLRSLPTLELRYRAHDVAARELAGWLQGRDEIAAVLHPALAGSPGHENWQVLCGADGAAAGLFSVVFDERFAAEQVDRFCDALRLFKLGFSWGGPMSLVVPYEMSTMRSAALGTWTHKGVLVRFSVGLEGVEDLQADLAQALEALRA